MALFVKIWWYLFSVLPITLTICCFFSVEVEHAAGQHSILLSDLKWRGILNPEISVQSYNYEEFRGAKGNRFANIYLETYNLKASAVNTHSNTW